MAFSPGTFAKQPYRPEPWDTGDNKTLDELLSTEQWELDFGINRYPRYLLDFPSLGSEIPDAVISSWGRNTSGRAVNASGLYESVPSGDPRLQYDFNGNPSGLLVEGAGRTNHNPYSSDLSQWIVGSDVSLGNAVTSVIDGETAYKASQSGFSLLAASGTKTFSSATETIHALIETDTAGAFAIGVSNSTTSNRIGRAIYDVSSDSVSTDRNNEGTIEQAKSRIVTSNAPNGGKLIHLILSFSTPNNGDSSGHIEYYPDTTNNGDTSIFHHGQREEAPNASSLIVTGSSAATRGADDYTIFSGGQPSWWNPNEGTILLELTPQFYERSSKFRIVGDDDARDYLGYGKQPLNIFTADASNNGVEAVTSIDSFKTTKAAVSFDASDIRQSVNGSSDNAGAHDGTLLDTTKLNLSVEVDSTLFERFVYFPRALSESTLNTLTS